MTSGDLHQNAQGSAVNAYATFAFLTGLDPRDRPFVARNTTNDPATMRHLADLAWARVQPLVLPEKPMAPARKAP